MIEMIKTGDPKKLSVQSVSRVPADTLLRFQDATPMGNPCIFLKTGFFFCEKKKIYYYYWYYYQFEKKKGLSSEGALEHHSQSFLSTKPRKKNDMKLFCITELRSRSQVITENSSFLRRQAFDSNQVIIMKIKRGWAFGAPNRVLYEVCYHLIHGSLPSLPLSALQLQ